MSSWQAPYGNQTWFAYRHTELKDEQLQQELGVYLLDVQCLRRIYQMLRLPDAAIYHALVVDWSHFCESCPELAELLMKTPRRILPLFDAALADTQLSLLQNNPSSTFSAEHTAHAHTELRHDRRHRRHHREDENSSEDEDAEQQRRAQLGQETPSTPLLFKPKCHVRLKNVFFAGLDRLPRALDSNRLVAVRGTVIRASAIKMLEWRREIECTRCKHRWVVQADIEQHYRFDEIAQCPSDLDPRCKSRTFELVSGSAECRDYQELKIQEQIPKIGFGSIPRAIVLIVEDDLVDVCQPGDDILVVGVAICRWDHLLPGSRCNVEMVISANNIRVNNKASSTGALSDEIASDIDVFWQKFAGRPLVARDFILSSVCPQIYGLHWVKLALTLVMLGGVERHDPTGLHVRGVCHLLLVGDPGTGKSQFLNYAAKLIPRSVLTTGIGTTSAGLTAAAVRDSGAGGDWMLEAGALVLADGGVCCIDEFSSIRSQDRTAIHEAMEQQSISVAKVGLVCKLNTRASVIAATNPKGSYDPTASISVNTAIGSPLLSRFDLVLVLLDERNDEWDRRVSSHILQDCRSDASLGPTAPAGALPLLSTRSDSSANAQHEFQTVATPAGEREHTSAIDESNHHSSSSTSSGSSSTSSGSSSSSSSTQPPLDADQETHVWGLETVRSYLLLAKHKFNPELTPASQIVLKAYYRQQRRANVRHVARTTVRLLENSIRLAQAHARLMWRNRVLLQDAVVAVGMIEASIHTCAMLGLSNILHTTFTDEPDQHYLEMEQTVCERLYLDLQALRAMERGQSDIPSHVRQQLDRSHDDQHPNDHLDPQSMQNQDNEYDANHQAPPRSGSSLGSSLGSRTRSRSRSRSTSRSPSPSASQAFHPFEVALQQRFHPSTPSPPRGPRPNQSSSVVPPSSSSHASQSLFADAPLPGTAPPSSTLPEPAPRLEPGQPHQDQQAPSSRQHCEPALQHASQSSSSSSSSPVRPQFCQRDPTENVRTDGSSGPPARSPSPSHGSSSRAVAQRHQHLLSPAQQSVSSSSHADRPPPTTASVLNAPQAPALDRSHPFACTPAQSSPAAGSFHLSSSRAVIHPTSSIDRSRSIVSPSADATEPSSASVRPQKPPRSIQEQVTRELDSEQQLQLAGVDQRTLSATRPRPSASRSQQRKKKRPRRPRFLD